MITILDFHILRLSTENYMVEIFARDQSKPRSMPLSRALARAEFNYPLSVLTAFELDQLNFNAKDPADRFEKLREFGHKLYRRLFTPDVERVWREHLDKAEFLALCLRIAPGASGLEALPWETMFDGEEFLAAGAKTGLSRLPLSIDPQNDLPAVTLPLKMFALVSSPLDLKGNERLAMEGEQEILLEAVNTPAGLGKLRLDFEDEAKLEILESSLEASYHILHYSGHGISPENGGGLLLEDVDGKSRPVSVSDLLQSLRKGEDSLRLVVISGCQTARTLHTGGFRDLARGLLEHGIPAVVAMQFSITDIAGLKFAELLYAKLIEGQPLEKALSVTRRALLLSDNALMQADALAPVLLTANGQCLKASAEEIDQSPVELRLDTGFFLGMLPRLGFGFYGRRREYRQIRDGLLQRNHRVVIIHGIGGIGKTALVSHAADRLYSRHKRFKGVYAFDCSGGALAPERIIIDLHRYFEAQGVKILQQLVHQPLPPDVLANYLAQVLSQWPLLLIFDNLETHLERTADGFRIADENLRTFLTTLVKATDKGSRFLFTTRYLFDLDAKRLGNIQSLPLEDLSRPEALSLMQKLPHLATAGYQDKLKALEIFGGHPYAMVALDRYCNHQPLSRALQDAGSLHAELREFLAIDLNCSRLSDRGRELLNRFAAFRRPEQMEAVEWVMGERVSITPEILQGLNRDGLPDELKRLSDKELIELLERSLPERRQAANLDQPIKELIEWGLLTPIQEDGQLQALSVHSLVRDFCRSKQGGVWRDGLRDAAAFYTNQTKLISPNDKTPEALWREMEAFELLMEAEDFADAASLLVGADPLLDRWGFGIYVESLYNRLLNKVSGREEAMVRHNIAVLHQDRQLRRRSRPLPTLAQDHGRTRRRRRRGPLNRSDWESAYRNRQLH